jgi:hypothetical protein
MRKKKRTSGSRPGRALVALALLAAGAAAASPARKNRKAEPFALIAGSVFRESGFSLAGAEVVVDAAPGAKPLAKFKRIKVVSDARGEFAIRVAPVPMRYTVSVSAGGFRPGRKEVSIQGEERVDLYFRLEPESK